MNADTPFSITAYLGHEGYAAEVAKFLAETTLSQELCRFLLPNLAQAITIQEEKFRVAIDANDTGSAQAYTAEIGELIKLQTELIMFLARKEGHVNTYIPFGGNSEE